MTSLASSPARAERETSRRAARWLRGQAALARPQVALTVAAGFSAGLLQIAQAWLVAAIVAAVLVGAASRDELVADFLLLLTVIAARAVAVRVGDMSGFAAGARVRLAVRDRLVAHLTALGPGGLAGRQSGGLAAVVLENVEALDGYYARYLPQLALCVLVPLAILAVVFPVNWVVGALLALAAPFIPLFMGLIGAGAATASRRQFRTLSEMGGYFLDRLRGMATLRLYGRAEAEAAGVAAASDAFRAGTMGVLKLAFLSSAVLELVASVGMALVAIYVGMGLLGFTSFGGADALTLATGLFLLLLAPDFFLPLRQLAAHYHDRASAIGAAERIMGILASPVAAEPVSPPRPASAELRFDRVRFAYPGAERPVLVEAHFTIRPGERVALAGASGSGKSTLLYLAMAFQEPDAGRVLLGGVDLRALGGPAARELIAYVPQSPYLFAGTLRENIALGRPDATAADVARAAALARVDIFADKLPLGLDTPLGERGQGLSGGQARRVALARALIKDAPLLLLDEPTANLDPENERLILDALDGLDRGRTLVVATHSAAVLARMNRIVWVEDGRVREDVREPALRQEGA